MNLKNIEYFLKNKRINSKDEINIKYLIEKGLIGKKYKKLKILGTGDIKDKLKVTTNFISKSANSKIQKAGGSVIISKEKVLDKKLR